MNSWKRSLGGTTGARAGAGTGPRVGTLMAGLPQQTGGIVESGEQRAERRVTSLTFQMGWLNRWVRAFKIVKAGKLVNY